MTLYIGLSPGKGRGVFAGKGFKKGEIIEACPVIVLPGKDIPHIEKTELSWYYFLWDDELAAIALGYGSLYNHSHTPNSEIDIDHQNHVIVFKALGDIRKGEEITHDYDWPSDGSVPVPAWFRECAKRNGNQK
jgi:uncharacterized protein